MKNSRHFQSLFHAFIVALLVVGWVVASNHCAFGLMGATAQAAATHMGCSKCGSVPVKHTPASGGDMECCKALHGVLADVAKVEVKGDTELFTLLDFVVGADLSAGVEPTVAPHATDPPPAISFAELILQRSLLAHAPPRFV